MYYDTFSVSTLPKTEIIHTGLLCRTSWRTTEFFYVFQLADLILPGICNVETATIIVNSFIASFPQMLPFIIVFFEFQKSTIPQSKMACHKQTEWMAEKIQMCVTRTPHIYLKRTIEDSSLIFYVEVNAPRSMLRWTINKGHWKHFHNTDDAFLRQQRHQSRWITAIEAAVLACMCWKSQ